MYKILQYGNKTLEQKSLEVIDFKDLNLHETIKGMLQVLEAKKQISAGLSAPQVGKLIRVAVCRRTDLEEEKRNKNPKWEVMINPKLIFKSPESSTVWEGCLSINHGDLFGQVTRPKHVEVEYFDEEGKRKVLKGSDFFSHVIQHELDHLNGVLFLKYVSDPTKLFTGEELRNN